jgi:hypothetical protein
VNEAPQTSAYPVSFDVEPAYTDRNRLTCFFRPILAIPHTILVGVPGGSGCYSGGSGGVGDLVDLAISIAVAGILNILIVLMSIVSWFVILFTGHMPRGIRDFTSSILNWQANAYAYIALLRDEYPPFGEGDYPVRFAIGEEPEVRNRLSVALRIFYVIPHAIVLIFVGIAWAVTWIIDWFIILFTGKVPEGLYRFGAGYLRWYLRVEAYFLLLQDKYPPFSLD